MIVPDQEKKPQLIKLADCTDIEEEIM